MIGERFTYKSKFDVYEDCYFEVSRYYNGNLAIEIWNNQVGCINRVTVNPDFGLEDPYIAVKNYEENEGILDFLVSQDLIVEEPVKVVSSGWVFISIHRLTEKGEETFLRK